MPVTINVGDPQDLAIASQNTNAAADRNVQMAKMSTDQSMQQQRIDAEQQMQTQQIGANQQLQDSSQQFRSQEQDKINQHMERMAQLTQDLENKRLAALTRYNVAVHAGNAEEAQKAADEAGQLELDATEYHNQSSKAQAISMVMKGIDAKGLNTMNDIANSFVTAKSHADQAISDEARSGLHDTIIDATTRGELGPKTPALTERVGGALTRGVLSGGTTLVPDVLATVTSNAVATLTAPDAVKPVDIAKSVVDKTIDRMAVAFPGEGQNEQKGLLKDFVHASIDAEAAKAAGGDPKAFQDQAAKTLEKLRATGLNDDRISSILGSVGNAAKSEAEALREAGAKATQAEGGSTDRAGRVSDKQRDTLIRGLDFASTVKSHAEVAGMKTEVFDGEKFKKNVVDSMAAYLLAAPKDIQQKIAMDFAQYPTLQAQLTQAVQEMQLAKTRTLVTEHLDPNLTTEQVSGKVDEYTKKEGETRGKIAKVYARGTAAAAARAQVLGNTFGTELLRR